MTALAVANGASHSGVSEWKQTLKSAEAEMQVSIHSRPHTPGTQRIPQSRARLPPVIMRWTSVMMCSRDATPRGISFNSFN